MHMQGNGLLEITQLPEALETNGEGGAEVVQKDGFVRVTIRGKVNGIPECRNCVLEVTRLPEALKTSF